MAAKHVIMGIDYRGANMADVDPGTQFYIVIYDSGAIRRYSGATLPGVISSRFNIDRPIYMAESENGDLINDYHDTEYIEYYFIPQRECFAIVESYTARFTMGNIKLGAGIASWSKLCTDEYFTIDRLGLTVQGTCAGRCEGCRHACYAKKSYRYGSVLYRHAVNTLAFRNNIDKAFHDLYLQLYRKRNMPIAFRIDQSGEIETEKEFSLWCSLAALFPDIPFYMYTKAFDIVTGPLLAGQVPKNLIVLISIWHESGIDVYMKLQHLDNVKAFVYMDGFNYSVYGIRVQTMCRAYNERGKLDHTITCDKCKKCFDSCSNHKIIGCNDH